MKKSFSERLHFDALQRAKRMITLLEATEPGAPFTDFEAGYILRDVVVAADTLLKLFDVPGDEADE